jgi:SRSO17 transposase
LARRMCEGIAPAAWVIDDTGFPEQGRMSVGVARQCCGALGKVGSCQIGVSVNAVSDGASCPIDWRLFIPEAWDEPGEFNVARRAGAHLPEDVHHVEKWRLALGMLDELIGWGLAPPVIGADGGYGEITEFRRGLEDRRLDYVVQVKAATSAFVEHVHPVRPAYRGRGRPPARRYRDKPVSLRELALRAGAEQPVEVTWREGSRGAMTSRFLALRVRPANEQLRRRAHQTDTELPVRWLLVESPQDAAEPVKYWLSNLPADTPLVRLVALAKIRWRIEHDYRELKDALGLDHFEGRSRRGWHHHVTLVSLARAFLTLERRRPRLGAAA